MFDLVTDRFRHLIFRSAVYDWLLAAKPPSSVRVPGGDAGLACEACWYADALTPPQGMTAPVQRADFRWLGQPHARSAEAWPHIDAWIS